MWTWSSTHTSGVVTGSGHVRAAPRPRPCAALYFVNARACTKLCQTSELKTNTVRQQVWREMVLWDEKLLEKLILGRDVSRALIVCDFGGKSVECLIKETCSQFVRLRSAAVITE